MSRYLSIVLLRLRSLLRRRIVESELEKEIGAHLEELRAEFLCQGLSPEDAAFAARRRLGNVAQVAEQCRDQRRTAFFETLGQDLRYSIRTLRRSPTFAAIGIVSLILGIGANTLMFSLVYSLLLRPLPFHKAEQLISINEVSPRFPQGVILPPEFADWLRESHTLTGLGAFNNEEFTLTGTREPQHLEAAEVSARIFQTLRVRLALGRTFSETEDGSSPQRVAILSYGLWQSQFGTSTSILGRSISLNSLPYTVVGVLPRQFRFPDQGQPDIYVPGGFSGPAMWNAPRMALLRVVGRLREHATIQAAQSELKTINERHLASIPTSYRNAFEARRFELMPLQRHLIGDLRPVLTVLWWAVCFLLLLTCSNLAALQLARAFARSGEFSIRLALGGSSQRLVRLLLTENLLLASTGAVFGVAIAYAALPAVRTLNILHLASPQDVSIDLVVLLGALTSTVGTAALFGLGPALAVSKFSLHTAIRSGARSVRGGGGGDRARTILVAVQVALALTLLLSAELLLRSAIHVLNNPLGLKPGDLVIATLRIDPQRYGTDPSQIALAEKLLQGLQQIPGVQSAGLTNALPLGGYSLGAALRLEGDGFIAAGIAPFVPVVAITPDYLRTLGSPVLAGRGIERSDRSSSKLVAVVNRTFVQHYFPHSDAIGKRLRLGADTAPWTTIVGIVQDMRHKGQEIDPEPEVFTPYFQAPGPVLGIAIRSALPLTSLQGAIRQRVHAVDPTMPVFAMATMEERISTMLEPRRVELIVVGTLSILGFLLAAFGVFGVMNYAVTRRMRDFGVRLALGAQTSQIAAHVMRRALLLALGGLIPGLILSYAAAQYLAKLLYKVSPEDWPSYVVAIILLAAAMLGASLVPARRAARIDPVLVLRWE